MTDDNQPLRSLIKNNKYLRAQKNDTIRAIAVDMPDHHTSAALIIEKKTGALVGLLTERDIVEKSHCPA